MRCLTLHIVLLLGGLLLAEANESTTYYVPQPIVAFGYAEEWTLTGKPHIREAYMILGIPYFQKHAHGPVYHPIASANMMANSDSDEGVLRDCNLLSLSKIVITKEWDSKIVHLDLTKAKVKKGSAMTLEVAAYAALECIRIVSNRYHQNIELNIHPPSGEKLKWMEIQEAFETHDMTKPFRMVDQDQDAPDRPVTPAAPKTEGKEKIKPTSADRSQ